MSLQITIVLIANFIIAFIGTLAYSVRLVGVKTGKIAISLSLFNILMLVSRIAVTFQVPLLANYVEANPGSSNMLTIFNLIIIVSSVAAICGAFSIPTFQKLLCKAVQSFSMDRSISKLIVHSFSKSGVRYMKECISPPRKENVTSISLKEFPIKIILLNLIAVAFLTVGSLAPIYACAISPNDRATCITLSSVINGIATIFMSIFIDPKLSMMTDDFIEGKCNEPEFKASIVGMVGSKAVGTVFALPLLVPCSYLIIFIAQITSWLFH